MDADAFFSQYGLGKSIKRKMRRISLYFRERDIVSSIAIDADLIEQPITFLAGFIFVNLLDAATSCVLLFTQLFNDTIQPTNFLFCSDCLQTEDSRNQEVKSNDEGVASMAILDIEN